MTALHLLADLTDDDRAILDPSADYTPRLRVADATREPIVPATLRPVRGGPVVCAFHGTAHQPGEPVATTYAVDCAESRDPSWWRERIELAREGRPVVRLVAFDDMDTLAGGRTLAVLEAGMMVVGVVERVVCPEAVAVVLPGLGAVYATARGEVDGLPRYDVAATTWRKISNNGRA